MQQNEADKETRSASFGRIKLGLPSGLIVGWLAVFVVFEWLRAKLGAFGSNIEISNVANQISALECVELFLLARAFDWRKPSECITFGETVVIFAALAFLVISADRPFVAAWLISSLLLLRFGWTQEYRAVAFGLFIFTSQYSRFLRQPFEGSPGGAGGFDAFLLRTALNFVGYAVTGGGSIVYNPSNEFGIDIVRDCASLSPLLTVIIGFILIIIGWRGYLVKTDLAYIAALVIPTIFINQLRLAPTALSREGYAYWHDGDGVAIVAAAYAILAVGAGYLAIQDSRSARSAP